MWRNVCRVTAPLQSMVLRPDQRWRSFVCDTSEFMESYAPHSSGALVDIIRMILAAREALSNLLISQDLVYVRTSQTVRRDIVLEASHVDATESSEPQGTARLARFYSAALVRRDFRMKLDFVGGYSPLDGGISFDMSCGFVSSGPSRTLSLRWRRDPSTAPDLHKISVNKAPQLEIEAMLGNESLAAGRSRTRRANSNDNLGLDFVVEEQTSRLVKWSPPPIDTRNHRRVTSALPVSLEVIGHLIVENQIKGREERGAVGTKLVDPAHVLWNYQVDQGLVLPQYLNEIYT
ncbi:hypothetical protein EVAR_18394_1 [Eumeta japonica]|uniref:Uncharacterized protein n=1 Tax=Eumeta variegata TaxID=151549 RepID=A0A4C1UVU3_EUMVA|nr:hypothetical protein EVAR_18394_1 [Eumeta japonica]